MAASARGRFRYIMDQEIDAMDLEALSSGLEDEPQFALGALLGEGGLAAQLAGGALTFDVAVPERFESFGKCIEILSVYLPEYVSGIEIAVDLDASGRRRRVECWRYIGRGGEVVRVALQHAIALDREVLPGPEDVVELRARWRELPQWARNAFKLTYEELGDLDSRG
jgi:hypothetical protein